MTLWLPSGSASSLLRPLVPLLLWFPFLGGSGAQGEGEGREQEVVQGSLILPKGGLWERLGGAGERRGESWVLQGRRREEEEGGEEEGEEEEEEDAEQEYRGRSCWGFCGRALQQQMRRRGPVGGASMPRPTWFPAKSSSACSWLPARGMCGRRYV